MPEFLERRFNSAARWYFSGVSVIGYVLTKISVTLFAGGVVMHAVTGLDLYTSASILIVITGLYTVFGGLRAVIYTEVMQAVVLIVGSGALAYLGLGAIGGWSGLHARLPADFFSMWKPSNHPDFPWTGVVFGAPILGLWYWCTDQHIVQRVLAAKNVTEARRGTVFAGFSRFFRCSSSCCRNDCRCTLRRRSWWRRRLGVSHARHQIASVRFQGSRARGHAGGACDFSRRRSPVLDAAHVGRSIESCPNARAAASCKPGVCRRSFCRSRSRLDSFMKYISPQIFIYLQSVQAYIAPPIAACFLFGVLSKRLTAPAAVATLLSGFVFGALRFGLELGKRHLPPGSIWAWIAGINFLHFATLLFVISTATLVSVSLAMPAPSAEKVADLTIGTTAVPTGTVEATKERRLNLGASVFLASTIAVLWIVFR